MVVATLWSELVGSTLPFAVPLVVALLVTWFHGPALGGAAVAANVVVNIVVALQLVGRPLDAEDGVIFGIWLFLLVSTTLVARLYRRMQQEATEKQLLLETIPDPVVRSTPDGEVLYGSPAFLRLFPTRNWLWELSPASRDTYYRWLSEEWTTPRVIGPLEMETTGGSTTGCVEISASLVTDRAGQREMFGVVREVTERIRREQRIQELVEQKDALIREVHHRIKNHMATLLSFISLQSNESDDAAVTAALTETQERVRIMLAIYDDLYKGRDMEEVNLALVIGRIVAGLERAYAGLQRVSLEQQVEDTVVSADTSLAAGIIVNELVTNAFKYAFPADHLQPSPRIRITVRTRNTDCLEIIVADNGIGTPGRVREGFGLTVVRSYARDGEEEVRIGTDPELAGLRVHATIRRSGPAARRSQRSIP